MSTKPRVMIFVQARMGSTRLPGKVLKKINQRALLSYEIERLKHVHQAEGLVVLTTLNEGDDEIERFCQKERVAVFRGSEWDVLERFHQAAHVFKAQIVVRICGDCPLIDPGVIDQSIERFLCDEAPYDYLSNTSIRTFPRGLDVEVFSVSSLDRVVREALLPEEREHVTPYYYRHPELFSLGSLTYPKDYSLHRWTVDTSEDFELSSKILKELYSQDPLFTWHDVLHLLEEHPEWKQINAHVAQKKV